MVENVTLTKYITMTLTIKSKLILIYSIARNFVIVTLDKFTYSNTVVQAQMNVDVMIVTKRV